MDRELRDLGRLVATGDLSVVPAFMRAAQRAGRASAEAASAVYAAQSQLVGHVGALELAWAALENADWIRLDTGSHGDWWVWGDEPEPPRVIRAVATGLGCILIHRSVLEKVQFRWDQSKPGFDDMFFCRDAQLDGTFKLWADTGIRCGHLEMDWEGIKK